MNPLQSFSTHRDVYGNAFQYHNLQPSVLNHIVSNSNYHHQGLIPSVPSSQLFPGVQNLPLPTRFGAYNSSEVVGNPYSQNNVGPVMHPHQNASQYQCPSMYVGDVPHPSVTPNPIDHQPFLWENGFVIKQAEINQKDQFSCIHDSTGGVDGRKKLQVNRRSFRGDQASTTRKKNHQWTQEEDDVLKSLVRWHGVKKWAAIAKMMPGRKGKQCRERWHNYLRPNIRMEKTWSKEEEEKFIDAHREVGNKWSKISMMLPGRTENEIKNHWNAIKRRQQGKGRRKQTDPDSPLVKYIKSLTDAAAAATSADPPPPHAAAAADANVNHEFHNAEPVQYENTTYLSFQDMDDSTCASTDIFAEAFSDKMNYSLFP